MLGLFKKNDGSMSMAKRATMVISPGSKDPRYSSSSRKVGAPFSVKTLRILYSSLLAEISGSTNGAWIEAWGRLGTLGAQDEDEEELEEGVMEQVMACEAR